MTILSLSVASESKVIENIIYSAMNGVTVDKMVQFFWTVLPSQQSYILNRQRISTQFDAFVTSHGPGVTHYTGAE